MFFLIKFTLSFSLSFLILSIPINNQTLFEQIHKTTEPFTQDLISTLKKNALKTTEDITEVGRKAFHNTSLEHLSTDKVKESQSSQLRREIIEQHQDYTVEEKESLLRILEKAQ